MLNIAFSEIWNTFWNIKRIQSPRSILKYMMYFNPLIMKNTFFFPKSSFSTLNLPFFAPFCPFLGLVVRKKVLLTCQEKSATPAKTCQWNIATRQTLSGKKCYSSQNWSGKICYSAKLVRKKMLLSHLIDLIDFRSSSMFCLTSFKLSSTVFLTRFGE